MGVEVEVRDTGATELEQRLGSLAQAVIFGVLDDADPYPDGTPVAEVAAVHEFGAGAVEQRSMLRGYVDGAGKKEIGDAGQDQIGAVVDGAQPDTVSKAIGDVAVAGVVQRMKAGINPPLKDDSGRTPLILTGHLRDSMDWTEVGS